MISERAGSNKPTQLNEQEKHLKPRKRFSCLMAITASPATRFPVPPGNTMATERPARCFSRHLKYFDIPVERVIIPFAGNPEKPIVGHLRLPKALPAPMIMHWGGIDNWKEERHSFGEAFVKEGWGCFIMDSPGTGECPLLAGPEADAVHTAALGISRPAFRGRCR